MTTMATGLLRGWFGAISGDGSKFYCAYGGNPLNSIFEIDLTTYATKTYNVTLPANCCYKVNLLENGKYVVASHANLDKPVFWSDGLPLTIDPMDQIYNY
jgi:hypothetical protein